MDDISKERFEGTILKAMSRNPRKEVKKEDGQVVIGQVEMKLDSLCFYDFQKN